MKLKIGKLLKVLLWIVGGVVALVVLLVATLPLWLGPVVKPSANALVPQFTKTSFNLGHLSLNPYTGRFELGDMWLGNPEGFNVPIAVSLSNVVVDVAMTTLGDKYIHVEDITVENLYASYISGGEENENNFKQIQYNLAGGKEKYERKAQAAKEKSAQDQAAADEKAKADAAAEKARLEKMTDEEREAEELRKEEEELAQEAAAKKVVIDHLKIDGVVLELDMITLPIPVTIELRDLGKKSEGMTTGELLDAIWQEILKAAMKVGGGAAALGGLIGDGASAAVNAVGSGASAAVNAAGSGASAAAGAIGSGASAAAGAVGAGASAAAGAVGDGAAAVGNAVGEGASKAVDAIKGIFGK